MEVQKNIGNLTGAVEKTEESPSARGGSALIWRGRWVDNRYGEALAIKVVLDQSVPPEELKRGLAMEMDIWRRLSHRNILELYGSTVDPRQFGSFPALVSPWCQHGSLRDLLNGMQGGLDRSLRFSIIRDFTDGLLYMHTAPSGPVVHGDLKAANILITEGFVAKIADFGLSRTVPRGGNDPTMTVRGPGTIRWMTPEAHYRDEQNLGPERPTWSTDVWAWAHLIYETVTNKIPYPQYRQEYQAAAAIVRGELSPRPAEDDPASDEFLTARFWPLLERCWAMEPRQRPRITTIAKDPLFTSSRVSARTDDPLALRQDPTRFGAGQRYRDRGNVAFRQGAFKEAIDYYDRARQSFERIDDKRQTAHTLHDLGWSYVRLNQHDEARTCFNWTRDLYRSMGDFKAELGAIMDLSSVERAAGNLQLSREYLQHTYDDCRQARLFTRSGWCLVATGLLDVDIQDWKAAHQRFEAAVEIAQRERSQGLLGRSRERQGDCYLRQDLRAQARKCYDDAARAYRCLPGEEDQVRRVERKIQGCHRIRYEDITSMPLWGIGDLPNMDEPAGHYTV